MQVSVIIPIYNAAPFLDISIKSALNQVQTSEVLLIDDRSTDGSWQICEEWARKDKRVRLFKNEGLKGAGAARNVGILKAKFAYIAFLDGDDFYLENRFLLDQEIFANHPIIDFITNSIRILSVEPTKNNKTIGLLSNKNNITFSQLIINILNFTLF